MWALDFQVDVTAEGRQVRFLNIIDEYTREALATRAARSFNADATIDVLDDLITTLGRKPQHIRMDNGPELTAHALMDWCGYRGVDPAFIDPGSPWQNGICESFNVIRNGVQINTNLQPPGGPEDVTGSMAVAANARLALYDGGQYLLARLQPGTPPDLAEAVRKFANNLMDIGARSTSDGAR